MEQELFEKQKLYNLTFLTCNNMKTELKEIKTATITGKGQLCIPNTARDIKGFKKGTKIAILVYDDRIELRPMDQIKKMTTMLLSEKSLAKEWNTKEEDEAWKDLQKGT